MLNLKLFIAKRYLFSKKSTHVINVISGITGMGIMLGTMALVVVLSVFNGLESLIINRFNSFDADLKIQPAMGKTFIPDSLFLKKLNEIPGVARYSEVIEENALIKYEESYHPFMIKGVSPTYAAITGVDTMMVNGRFMLDYQGSPVAVIGMEVSSFLSVSLNFVSPLKIYVPNRNTGFADDPEKAFQVRNIYPVGIYSIDPEINQYVIVPIAFARDLLGYNRELSALELQLNKGANENGVKKAVKNLVGKSFVVKNRYEQHETLYRIMKSEKLIVFLILAFILLIASFNVIGSLTMLIIEKKEDVVTFRSMGMSIPDIRKIFLLEGWLIAVLGAVAGLFLGAVLCLLQQKYGFIPMQGSTPNSFIVDSYPVDMKAGDFILTFVTVLSIGYVASRFPVRYITRRYMGQGMSKSE
jgi:lipoprotein-releasing system permease protein